MFDNALPTTNYWLVGASGHKGCSFNPVITRDEARAEIYLDADKNRNKSIFHALYAKKEELEKSFGGSLDWQELPDKKPCRICVHYKGYNWRDEEYWEEIINFLAENMTKLVRVFQPVLDELDKP